MVKNCDRGLENAAGGLRPLENLAVFTALNRSGSLSLKKKCYLPAKVRFVW